MCHQVELFNGVFIATDSAARAGPFSKMRGVMMLPGHGHRYGTRRRGRNTERDQFFSTVWLRVLQFY